MVAQCPDFPEHDCTQECTCKIDKSLNRRICIKFESRKNCLAGINHCDKSDFEFCIAEHNELTVKTIVNN